MDDTAACADLCESHGFAAPAAALRALAEGRAPFYLVRSITRGGISSEGFSEADIAPPTRRIFRDRASAERCARSLTVRALRRYELDLHYGPPSHLTADQFARAVGAILGAPYELPRERGPLIPGSATDAEVGRIGELLDFTLFDVAEFGHGNGRDD